MKYTPTFFIVVFFVSVFFLKCDKEENTFPPTVLTASADEIYATTTKVGGKITDNGGEPITERGIYWSTESEPEYSGQKIVIETDSLVFYHTLTGLSPGVKYYVKAFASNTKGTSFGKETFFSTQVNYPAVSTRAATEITANSAVVGGTVEDNGGFEVTERGVYWSKYSDVILNGEKLIIGSGDGDFSTTLEELSVGEKLFFRAYAQNLKGTSFGAELSFTTGSTAPGVNTSVPSQVTVNSAVVGGFIYDDGGTEMIETGVWWGTEQEPETTGNKLIIESSTNNFSAALETLNPETVYYVKAFATNGVGTNYGDEMTFETLGQTPAAQTFGTSDITQNSAKLYGIVYANGLSTSVTFEYGTSDNYGNTVTANGSPTENDADTLSVEITGLEANRLYHFRIVAENELGIAYGNDTTFKTVLTGLTGSVSDADGNTYSTIGIGHQIWMTENLKTTKYNDSTDIPLVNDGELWAELSSPAFCWYDTSEVYTDNYGGLYNWYVVNTGKLCPLGWHVPTIDDWRELAEYAGGASVAGGKLKQTGTTYWLSPNSGATNVYEFNARAGGYRDNLGNFDMLKLHANWWTAAEYSGLTSYYLYIVYDYENIFEGYMNKKYGMSVRCIKN